MFQYATRFRFRPIQKAYRNISTNIKILYGSQTGTAHTFANELASKLPIHLPEDTSVDVLSLAQDTPETLMDYTDPCILLFVVACYGQGEPTDNAKDFFKWLMIDRDNDQRRKSKVDFSKKEYAIFGLGNSLTHCNNYNVVGKSLDGKLAQLGAKRIYDIGLGDDTANNYIEDDFDEWSTKIIDILRERNKHGMKPGENINEAHEKIEGFDLIFSTSIHKCDTTKRDEYCKKPSDHLLKQLFPSGSHRHRVIYNRPLSMKGHDVCMHEMAFSTTGENDEAHNKLSYETGDHFWICPQNVPQDIKAYIEFLEINPDSVIVDTIAHKGKRKYPYPTGITVRETLQYCVDFGALPSPSLARSLLKYENFDYREDIAMPKKTLYDILVESDTKLTLGQILYNAPSLSPRYYSISSSCLEHPHEILLTYRPLKYSCYGKVRSGICSSYLRDLIGDTDDNDEVYIVGGVRHSNTFRLPADPTIPILFIAGGTGIAPIRGFIEERIHLKKQSTRLGDAHLFFGVRDEEDMVYSKLIELALKKKALTKSFITYSNSPQNRYVSHELDDNSSLLFEMIQKGCIIYICGGAGGFATSCVRSIKKSMTDIGGLSSAEADQYYETLLNDGRIKEDIAE